MLSFVKKNSVNSSYYGFCLTTLSTYLRICFSRQHVTLNTTPNLQIVYHPEVSQTRCQQANPFRNISSIYN